MVGSRWLCTDESLEQYSLKGTVISAETNPDYNGDGDVEMEYDDGSGCYMKLRRFVMRHRRLEE